MTQPRNAEPGMNVVKPSGDPIDATYKLNRLAAAGTLLLAAAVEAAHARASGHRRLACAGSP